MTYNDTQVLNAVLRQDFRAFLHRTVLTLNPGGQFLPNWHIDAITHVLEEVRAGKIKRLIINLPPRHLKSIISSVAFPAFLLGHDPRRRIIEISYGTDLATKHASDFRSLIHSAWFQRAFPQIRIARSTESEVFTSERGFRRATSVGAALTGFGGDVFIIDDPQKPVDAQSEPLRNQVNNWFTNTMLSRLDNKETGVIIVVMQRVHQHDLTGYLLENPGDWTVLSLPAIAEVDENIAIGNGTFHLRRAGEALHPEHESLAALERLRREVGSDVFAAQYQQAPVPPGGAMIKRQWLRYYRQADLPERSYRTKVIQSWDTAAKDGAQNDWSVCTTWLVLNKEHYYLLDLTRGRYEYPRLRETAIALAQRHKPDVVLVEDTSVGTALAQELKKILTRPVKPISVDRDKVGRLYVHQAKFEAGLVLFPQGAPFLPELETELLSFPQAKHDDQVDSITQALSHKPGGYDGTMAWATT
jgi:predicted phage terminase large subunit-like protein